MNSVRVFRNRTKGHDWPWLVSCVLCSGRSELGIFGFALSVKWWAPTWEIAQTFATAHARDHEATRCPTCLHLPERQLAPEETTVR